MNKTEQSRIAFDKQADTYDTACSGKHARELYPFMLEVMIQLPVRDVLDLGCGTCALMKQLYDEDSRRRFTGIDLSENMLRMGKQVMKGRAKLLLGDAAKLPFPDASFDLVYCNDSFHHYSDPCRVLQEVGRVLRYGGFFVIGDCTQGAVSRRIMNLYFRFQREGDVHMYSEKEIRMLLQKQLHDVHVQRVNERSLIAWGVK